MEAAALNGPPPWLERIVLLMIPPAAREAVAGDLWETYQTPAQYAAEALHTVPMVVASQMRRNLYLPALMLQGTLALTCIGRPAALALLPLLMLQSAYQPVARPAPGRAFRDSIALALGVTVLLQILALSQRGVDHATWLSMFLLGLLLGPLLCIFRMALILGADHVTVKVRAETAMDELAETRQRFLRRARLCNLMEASALAIVAAWGGLHGWTIALPGLFILVAVYLLLEAVLPRIAPERCDFVSLRTQYQQELARRQQLRSFLWWLWCAPGLVTLHTRLIQTNLTAGHRITPLLASVGAVLLCFLITALNREQAGQTQEQIAQLDRVRQAPDFA